MWMKFGALSYMECRGDDMTPPQSKLTFPKMTKAKEDEEVWFSFITHKSKAERNKTNKLVMAYFEKKFSKEEMKNMPVDMKRMAYGGFIAEVEGK